MSSTPSLECLDLISCSRDVDQSNEALVEMRKQIDFNQIQNSDAFKQMSTEFRSTFDSISSRIIDTIVDQSEVRSALS